MSQFNRIHTNAIADAQALTASDRPIGYHIVRGILEITAALVCLPLSILFAVLIAISSRISGSEKLTRQREINTALFLMSLGTLIQSKRLMGLANEMVARK